MESSINKMRIGNFLIRKGLLKPEQVDEVLHEQNKNLNNLLRMRFGRIAVNKGYITEKVLNSTMMEKYQAEKKTKKKEAPYKFLI